MIENGTLGLSSHHGIHGNGARDVLVRNVTFANYEVAAISVNGVHNFVVVDSVATGSRSDVPVAATFSAARFLTQFIDVAPDATEQEAAESETIYRARRALATAKTPLQAAIDATFAAVEAGTPDAVPRVFQPVNEHGLIDGNGYGFLFNVLGVAVNGFVEQLPALANASTNVLVQNCTISDTAAAVDEVVCLRELSTGRVVVDTAGSVLQIARITDADGRYVGTVLSDAQVALGRLFNASAALRSNPLFKGLYIPDAIVQWAADASVPIGQLVGFELIFNGDSMLHLNKGVLGINANGVYGLTLDRVTIDGVLNVGVKAELGNHPAQTASMIGYTGDDAVGASFSSCRSVVVLNSSVRRVVTEADGDEWGVHVRGQSRDVALHCVDAGSVRIGEHVESVRTSDVQSDLTVVAAPLAQISVAARSAQSGGDCRQAPRRDCFTCRLRACRRRRRRSGRCI